MAKTALLPQFVHQYFDNTGAVLNGGTLNFYAAGTSTAKDTYADSAQAVTNPNPITLDSSGRPSNSGSAIQIWLDGAYKLVVKNSAGTTIRTEDNLTALAEATGYAAKTANYTVAANDYAKLINVDTTTGNITITLPAAATAGSGYMIYVAKSSSDANTVIIDGNSAETINGATTYTMYKQYDLIGLICDGSGWITREIAGEWVYVEDAKGILDSSGNEQLIFQSTASAVNYVEITNAATGNNPTIASAGSDTDVGLTIDAQAAGSITIGSADTGGVTVADALAVTDEDSRTATVDYPVTITSTTDGTPAAGIGTGILIQAESADENPSQFGAIEFCATDIDAGSEDTYFDILCRVAGAALTKVYRFIATGAFKGIFTHANTADRTYTLPDTDVANAVVQRVSTQTGAVATGTTTIPFDDTIPQNTEGDQYLSVSITPKSSSNILVISASVIASHSNATTSASTIALFQDSTADALASSYSQKEIAAAGIPREYSICHTMSAGTTSATTFKIRLGAGDSGTTTVNGITGSRISGGVANSYLMITEYAN
jgi:hypothetical protein